MRAMLYRDLDHVFYLKSAFFFFSEMKATLYFISIITMVIAANQYEDKSSELGFKLARHAYSSTVVSDYPECLGMCLDDPRCRSLNFGLKSGNCEFNNVSKVGVGLDDFLKDSDSIFSDIVGRESKGKQLFRERLS